MKKVSSGAIWKKYSFLNTIVQKHSVPETFLSVYYGDRTSATYRA